MPALRFQLVQAVALLALRAAAQTPCVNSGNGAYTGVMRTGASTDGKTSGQAEGLITSNAAMTAWYFLMGCGLGGGAACTPENAAIGTYLAIINASSTLLVGWDYTLPTNGCVNVTLPSFSTFVSFAAVGPGQVWSNFTGTATVLDKKLEVWANFDGETVYMDTDTCTPAFIVGSLSALSLPNATYNWVGIALTESVPQSKPQSFYHIPSKCWA